MNTARVYDIISLVFITLSALMLVFVVVRLLGPEQQDEVAALPLPTGIVLPSATPTFTVTPSATPTATLTPSNTPTFTEVPTETQSVTPSPTITETPGPTPTPSATFTPSASPTATDTATPVGPTLTFTPTDNPFLFTLRDDILFNPNTANAAGCAWQGIGGNVLGVDGQETDQVYQIHVYNDFIDTTQPTGSNSLYGARSGFEVKVADTINQQVYFVRLETTLGTALSPEIQVAFPGDCNSNVAILRFIQTRDRP